MFGYIEDIKGKINDTSVNCAELFEKLKTYQKQILQVEARITDQFQGSIKIFTQSIDSSKDDQEKLLRRYFQTASAATGNAMLSKLQNNIRINENRMLIFCNEQVGSMGDWYGIACVLLANTMVLKPRDTLEITAGILAFDKRFDAKVLIQNKEFSTTEDGFAHHKLKAASRPGKYLVPVKINYADQNGKQQSIQKEIEYTVANIQKQ